MRAAQCQRYFISWVHFVQMILVLNIGKNRDNINKKQTKKNTFHLFTFFCNKM